MGFNSGFKGLNSAVCLSASSFDAFTIRILCFLHSDNTNQRNAQLYKLIFNLLTEVCLDLEDETSKLGMEINEKKTKYMVTSTYEHRRNAGDL